MRVHLNVPCVAEFEDYQLSASRRWLSCSLVLLSLWVWIAIDQPHNAYAGTWRRGYLVSIGQQILILTMFKEWVLDSKSCNPNNLHWAQQVAVFAMLAAVVLTALQLALVVGAWSGQDSGADELPLIGRLIPGAWSGRTWSAPPHLSPPPPPPTCARSHGRTRPPAGAARSSR
jgi:hypothetical protein